MLESESPGPVIVPGTRDKTVEVNRAPLGRTRNRRLLGLGLIVYGVLGIVIFLVVAVALNRPLDRIGELSQSVEEQRALLVDSMLQGETTIRDMASGVRRMDASLTSARAATSRSSQIAASVATSMYDLRDAMSISIFGTQPLVNLASGFDQTGSQLVQLSSDLTTIGASLEANSADVVTSAADMGELADTVATLRKSVETGPDLSISTEALDGFRVSIFVVAGWLLLFALGCVVVGAYLFRLAQREHAETVDLVIPGGSS
jgi:hypothetical protein